MESQNRKILKESCGVAQVRNEFHDRCVAKVRKSCPPVKKASGPRKGVPGKTYVLTDTGTGLRNMIIPSKDTNYYSILLDNNEFSRLQEQSKMLTPEEKQALCDAAELESKRVAEESRVRKARLQSLEVKGGVAMGPKQAAMEAEATDRANYLLKRAWRLRQEQTDDVRDANSRVLETKVRAILDKQVAQNKLIKEKFAEENERLDKIYDDERTRFFAKVIEQEERNCAKKMQYRKELDAQMKAIIGQRWLDEEKKVEDSHVSKELEYVVLMEELENFKKKAEDAEKMQRSLNEANESIIRGREREKIEGRILDLRCQMYQKDMDRRAVEAELKKTEKARKAALQLARDQARQSKMPDIQGMKEDAAILRREEEVEMDIREKEKAAALKKKKLDEDFRKGLDEQTRYNVMRDMATFVDKRNVEISRRNQVEAEERDRLLALKKVYEREVYREGLLRQMNDDEQRYMDMKKEGILERLQQAKGQGDRKAEMKEIMAPKFEAMRRSGVPEQYVQIVMNKLNLC